MWFKKKSVLQAEHHYDTEKSADGTTDLRTTQWRYSNNSSSIRNSGLPSAADAGKYFYLPALGRYDATGQLNFVGNSGFYWSSSTGPWLNDGAYNLLFNSGNVVVEGSHRSVGYRVGGFE